MSHPEPDVNEQWHVPADLDQLEFMFQLFKNGLLGVKEFRNYLAERDETFKKVRDASIDNAIDQQARDLERLRSEEEERQREERERRQQELARARES